MSEVQGLFVQLREKPKKLARLLHTLSFLEYIGARKILKSQHESQVSLNVLGHVAEEIRHARVFKKLAMEMGGNDFGGYIAEDLLCMSEAEVYFQTVDAAVGRAVSDPSVAYALTTLLVEERALDLYPDLEKLLSSLGFSGRVAGILKEEEVHLRSVRQDVLGLGALAERCKIIEKNAFAKLLEVIELAD